MQHLAILTRLLILEEQDGPADISDTNVSQFIDKGHDPEGIGNYSYEDTGPARSALSNMQAFYRVFRDDVADGYGMRELQAEYVIISLYLLLRHLRKHYVWAEQEAKLFRAFTIWFDKRRRERREDDSDIQVFTSHRQQSGREIKIRDRVIRQLFFRVCRCRRCRDSDEGQEAAVQREPAHRDLPRGGRSVPGVFEPRVAG